MKLDKAEVFTFLSGPFSNFTIVTLSYDNITFTSTEQLFMYMKAKHFKDQDSMTKLSTPLHPRDAKQIGREVKNYKDDEWDKVRYSYMLEANKLKYQNSYFKTSLLNTKDRLLIECNPKDFIWSCGLRFDDPKVLDKASWKGKNLLGEVLMEIRDQLQQ